MTQVRILRSVLLLSIALTVGSATAALAGGPRVPIARAPVFVGMKGPVSPPSRQPSGQGGVVDGGGGGSGALCYDQAPGCHQPY